MRKRWSEKIQRKNGTIALYPLYAKKEKANAAYVSKRSSNRER